MTIQQNGINYLHIFQSYRQRYTIQFPKHLSIPLAHHTGILNLSPKSKDYLFYECIDNFS